ncbi:M48 family metalloprotease [Fimbriimonas ginsengisoli]|uniref:Peptidase M48, Ste24p n=1 Tax=Fimbriimonas ginsengisoli Gsoil 348 TaxID=661478 RepID=A0A068NRQ3_FIMGI|nr:M48 family metalloprotease [Fimbriimonas ginsengisoli]AIE85445.1 peptidase M48, Ste24p [Fimbriimonas ginsengisoli Gsoil 348]
MIPALLAMTLIRPRPIPASPVERLVANAWREVETQQPIDKQEQKHRDDIKRDREVGAKYVIEVEKDLKVVPDKDLNARIEKIGRELADVANITHADALWGDKRMNTFDYVFKIVEDKEHPEEVNAFSLPGGFIYVYRGLIDFAESDDELAGVLSHEIAHAAFRHVATLQSEQAKMQKIEIPLIIAMVLAKGTEALPGVLSGASLLSQAYTSGWSVRAEEAADYGGFQYMLKSKYDPTGILTFMERLAMKEVGDPRYAHLGIFQTHPPGRERAESLLRYMKAANVPIRRSRVASSFRAEAKPADDGTVAVSFGGKPLVSFAGNDALTRADAAVRRLNNFFDSVPEMYEVRSGDDGNILGRRQELLALTQDDAAAAKTSMDELQKATLTRIRGALFKIGYRVWEVR